MPRLPGGVRRLGFFAACAALPPALLHAALASAAGTVFEATPFVLAAALLPGRWAARWLALGSCGCGSLPGALALPAFGLCWLAFGPQLAFARLGAGLAVAYVLRGRGRAEHVPDALATLRTLGLCAFGAALASELLRGFGPGGTSFSEAAGLVAGAATGVLSPCASAGVATAAGLRGVWPAAAAGLLATAGVLALPGRRPEAACVERDARGGYALLACACAWLVLRGGAGFVHPRLLVPIALGAAGAASLTCGKARTRSSGASLVGCVLLAALVFGSPVPQERIDATNLADAFAGARLRFSGVARTQRGTTVLVRYAIACCRADASPIAVFVEAPLPVSDGAWIDAQGTLVRAGEGLTLRVASWRKIAPPADPFVYR
ncbi:MAG TPA: hypothetical protein VKG44_03380 [Candidatus Baltobacteraceae bacterium]|nr:hypothetical protein [Candidatus Baltobacteraceae bacterium]